MPAPTLYQRPSMSEYFRTLQQSTTSIASLTIELTERCNNDCIHCCINLPVNDSNAIHREMTTGQVKDVMRQAAELGYLQVLLTGGEPLLRADFEELYLFARRLGFRVLLFTNGRLITQRIADLFARVPPLVDIEITVYGMHSESYEAVTRASGSFNQFVQGVQRLWERGIPFVVKSALLPPNRAEIDEFEAGLAGIPWKIAKPTYALRFNLRSRRDNPDKNRLIALLRNPPQECISIVRRDDVRYSPWTEALACERLHPPGDCLFNCDPSEGETVCVDSYGFAQPCTGIRSPQFTYDLFQSVNSKTLQPTNQIKAALDHFTSIHELRATNPDYLRRCARCFLKGICGQCPARSWVEYGTFDTPVEHLCEMAHTWARLSGWLGENEHGWEIVSWQGRLEQA